EQRAAFTEGTLSLGIDEGGSDLAEHLKYLHHNADSNATLKASQQTAFIWVVALRRSDEEAPDDAALQVNIQSGPIEVDGHAVTAHISGNIWTLLVEPGQRVEADQPLLIVEAMKMEFAVHADRNARVGAIHCAAGRQVNAGDLLLVLEE